MNSISGKGKAGLLAVFAVLLMPLLGVGTASAFEVGEKVTVLVPDLQEFVKPMQEHQFTCRAITDHAVWLVQDSSIVDNKGGNEDTTFVPKIVWGTDPTLNMVNPDTFGALTSAFESSVWGTVASMCGPLPDVNGDGKVVIVLAAIPTKYDAGNQNNASRNTAYHVDPSLNEINGVEMEVFYINIHALSTSPSNMPAAEEIRIWNTANGLAYLTMILAEPLEEPWLLRGLAEVAQYECFGFTASDPGDHGHYEAMNEFRKSPYLELENSTTGVGKYDYAASRGQSFLFLMYFAQRLGSDFVPAVAKDIEHVGMESVAYAIDPSHDPETAQQDLVVPLYYDWLVCNLHNDYRSDFDGGIYKYDFLEGTTQEEWAHAGPGASAAFTMSFASYPIPGKIAPAGFALPGPIWSSQYVKFNTIDQDWVTHFNGQYSDGRGARAAINSRWEGLLILCDDDAQTFTSITALEFNDLYNSDFTISGPDAYLIVTNNNPGGVASMRYFISNDADLPVVETAIHQNSVMSQYITTYTTMYDVAEEMVENFDWVGPIFHATVADSTLDIKMTSFFGDIWTGVFPAWTSGTYELSFAGYDSSGHSVETIRTVAVGFADNDLSLSIENCELFVPLGGAPSGAMVTLSETNALGLSMETSAPLATSRSQMTGVIAGPVTFPDVNGTLSFVSATNDASVYRYTEQGWVMLNSWRQNGNTSAAVEQGGIYALGEGIGAFAPELPAQLVLGATSPNPFSAQTAISFGLPVDGNVRVNVFDMSGRLVTTLANEEMAAANHTLVWDGTDVSGNVVGAGVYFCRLEAAGTVLTQKMLKVQ